MKTLIILLGSVSFALAQDQKVHMVHMGVREVRKDTSVCDYQTVTFGTMKDEDDAEVHLAFEISGHSYQFDECEILEKITSNKSDDILFKCKENRFEEAHTIRYVMEEDGLLIFINNLEAYPSFMMGTKVGCK